MDALLHAIQTVCTGLSGARLAAILHVPRRSADRRLASLRNDQRCDSWTAPDLAHLIAWEQRERGTTHLLAAVEDNSTEHRPADSNRAVIAVDALAASQNANLTLLVQLARDCSDGILQDDEVRRLLPLVDDALAAGANAQQALRRLQNELLARIHGHD